LGPAELVAEAGIRMSPAAALAQPGAEPGDDIVVAYSLRNLSE
jgi:hypothetical protein